MSEGAGRTGSAGEPAAGVAIGGRRPGPRAWAAIVGAETRMVVRDTAGLVIPLALPLLLMLANGMAPGVHEPVPGAGGRTAFEVYLMPMVLTMVIATIGMINMPSFLAYYRKDGVLRRLAVTPAHPSMVLGGQVVTSAVQSALGITLALVVAMALLGARPPSRPLPALGVFVLAAAAMYAAGVLIAALAPSGNAATAIGLVVFFATGAAGGMFGSAENLPEPIFRIGELLPFGASVQAVGDVWAGAGPQPEHLAALAVMVLLGGAGGVRFFRWQ